MIAPYVFIYVAQKAGILFFLSIPAIFVMQAPS